MYYLKWVQSETVSPRTSCRGYNCEDINITLCNNTTECMDSQTENHTCIIEGSRSRPLLSCEVTTPSKKGHRLACLSHLAAAGAVPQWLGLIRLVLQRRARRVLGVRHACHYTSAVNAYRCACSLYGTEDLGVASLFPTRYYGRQCMYKYV